MLEDKEIGFILHKADMAAKYDFNNELMRFGITPGQLTVLNEINKHSGNTQDPGLAPACIADRIGCDRPTTTGIIDRLELQGWVVRMQNQEDKRSCIICLTEKAKNNLDELNHISAVHQSRILKDFTEEEAVLFRNLLIRVINQFTS